MHLNSNQTKAALIGWQGSQPLKIIPGYTQLAPTLGSKQERVYMDCQNSIKQSK